MPGPASIVCPHCRAGLKLKDRSKLGQKITCPKCKKPFRAQEKVEDQDEDEFAGLIAQDREDEDEEESPPPRPAPTSRPTRGKKRGKSSGSKLPLVIGGAVALVVFVAVGLTIQHFLKGAGQQANVASGASPDVAGQAGAAVPAQPAAPAVKTIDFEWLPPQAEAVVYLRPGDFIKSPFAQWVVEAAGNRESFQQSQETLRQQFGIGLDEIDSITIGIKSLGELAAGAADLAPGGIPNPMQAVSGLSKLREKEIVGVGRLSKPVDLPKNPQFQAQTEPVTYNGHTYYRDKAQPGQASSSFTYFPSPTVVVISGREDALKGLIDRQGKSDPRAELQIIDPDQHLAFAFLVKPELAPAAGTAPDGADSLATFKKVKSGCFAIKATDGLELSVRQSCPDAKTAEEVQAATDALVVLGREKLEQYKSTMTNLGKVGDALLASIKTSRRELVVETAASIPASSRDSLKAAPGEVLTAVLMGGLKGADSGSGGQGIPGNALRGSGSGDEFKGEVVVAQKLPELPEGVTLRGRGGWSGNQLFEKDGTTPRPRLLTFDVDYVDGPAAKAIEYGALRITEVKVDPEQHLKISERPATFGEASPFKEFVEVKHESFLSNHPENGVRVELDFERPAFLPSKFTGVEGTVTLRIAEETKDIIVPKVLEQAGKQPTDPDLKAAGFSVTSKTKDGEKTLTITFAKGAKVGDVKFIGPDGQPHPNAPFMLRLDLWGATRFGGQLPTGNALAGMGAKVTLHTKISEVTVPFRFENVPIPAPPDPGITAGIPWRLSSGGKGAPEGLAVEGRLNWGQTFSFGDKPPPPQLDLDVDVTGAKVLYVVGVGFQRIEKADSNTAGALTMKKSGGLAFGNDRGKQQFDRVHKSGLFHSHPPDGVRVAFSFEPVQQPFTKIDFVSGGLKLLVARERKKTILDKVASRVGKTVSNADLRGAGIDIKLTNKDQSLTMQVVKGNPMALGDAGLMRESSETMDLPILMHDPFTKAASIFLGDDKLKPNDALEITYYTGLTEIEVPFAFEDLAVPPVPKKEK
jgi:hypothetical protein